MFVWRKSKAKDTITVFQQKTPNPNSRKFILNVVILSNHSLDYRSSAEASNSEFAQEFFKIPGVSGVFFMDDFISITKTEESKWKNIAPKVEEITVKWLSANKPIISGQAHFATKEESELVKKINHILNNHVNPQIASHGGSIAFHDFQDGVVYVKMKGACAGCPSVTLTLRAGVEATLKKLIPEVEGVESI